MVVSLWWAVALTAVWALGLGALFGLWLERQHAADFVHLPPGAWRATSYFASAIGGASEMTLLAERHGARTDLVAAAHSVRLVIVVLSVPFAMQWAQGHWGLQVDPLLLPGTRAAAGSALLWVALATAAGVLVMYWLQRANPWFMGALLVSMGLALAGMSGTTLPSALTNAAQLVIGVSLGVRFQRDFLQVAPRWLASVALGTLAMMVMSAGFGLFLAWATGLHPATLILGTSPGGIAEMAITAKVLQLGVPVVTAFQVCRLVAVLVLVGPIFDWLGGRKKTA
jgi:membrane AbrB-like protein